jgi:hypothetical protein
MSNARRKLSLLLQALVGLLLAVVLLAVALLTAGDYVHLPWLRFISESDPEAGRPPQEAFDRFRRQQEDIANAEDRGPIRCTLTPWTEGGNDLSDLKLSLTNFSVFGLRLLMLATSRSLG